MLAKERNETRWLNTASMVILATVAVAFTLVYTRQVLIPFVLALFIVSLVAPIQDLLALRLRFPRALAVFASLMVALAIMLLLAFIFSSAINTVITTVVESTRSDAAPASAAKPATRQNGEHGVDEEDLIIDEETVQDYLYKQMVTILDPPLTWLNKKYPRFIRAEQAEDIIGFFKRLSQELTTRLFSVIGNAVGSVLGWFSSCLFVTIFTIFLLSGRNPRAIRGGVAADVDHKIRRYIITKVAISGVTGILVWVSLRLIGLELASVFGILAFLLNFIPSIGSVISTFLPIPMALIQFRMDIFPATAMVLLIPGSIQMLMGSVLEPKLMGEGLNLHPVTILLALAFWGLLWGVVGMFLAAPMTAVVRIVFMQFDMLRPMGELMAGKIPDSLQRSSA